MMGDFHFLRPWWLLAIVPVLLLAWMVHRQSQVERPWKGIIADHLLPYLIREGRQAKRMGPVLLLAASWGVCVLALAGPTWQHEQSPFADDTAALVILIKVSPSMRTEDMAPNRLERSIEKIHDLLALRRDAKAALIAYSSTAHVVMPLTTDTGIIETFAQSLDPSIMPEGDGDAADAAFKLASQVMGKEGGSILWITDGVEKDQHAALQQWRDANRIAVHVWAPLAESGELQSLRAGAQAVDAKVQAIAPDDSDTTALAREAKFVATAGGGDSERWKENGYWLTPVLVLLSLPFFRRGWMAPIAART